MLKCLHECTLPPPPPHQGMGNVFLHLHGFLPAPLQVRKDLFARSPFFLSSTAPLTPSFFNGPMVFIFLLLFPTGDPLSLLHFKSHVILIFLLNQFGISLINDYRSSVSTFFFFKQHLDYLQPIKET